MMDYLLARRRVVIWWLAAVLAASSITGVALVARKAAGTGASKSSAKKKQDKAPPPAPVELSEVRRGEISTHLETTASLEARNAAVLVAQHPGQVVALLAEEGKAVARGDVLARLDDRDAELAVQRTELAADVAQREVERGKQLHEQGYLSLKELDDLEVRRRNAWVELEQARLDRSRTRITAPFSGRVVNRMVNLGETVVAGKECFRVEDFNPLLARLYFPERELPRVKVGQAAVVSLDAFPGREFAARVTLVNPVVDRANGTFKATLEVSDPSGVLRPGAFARVRLETGRFADALLLPRRGVLTEDGEDYVFVARGDSVVRVPVKVGAAEGETAQILAGLAAGDRVVTVGQGGLKPGAKIKAVTL